jgi:hypothetical protein
LARAAVRSLASFACRLITAINSRQDRWTGRMGAGSQALKGTSMVEFGRYVESVFVDD